MNFNEFVTLVCLIKAAEESEDQHSGGEEEAECAGPISVVNGALQVDTSIFSVEQLANFRVEFDKVGRCLFISLHPNFIHTWNILAQCHSIFRTYNKFDNVNQFCLDTDKSGSVSVEELANLCAALGGC